MEFRDLPPNLTYLLVEHYGCWLLRPRHSVRAPRPFVDGKERNFKKLLWQMAGMAETGSLMLISRCGDCKCVRPEHQRPSVRLTRPGMKARHSRNHRKRQHVATFKAKWELVETVKALERRGFVRAPRGEHRLRVMSYRVSVGKGAGVEQRRIFGPWVLYWQEPFKQTAQRQAVAA